MFFFVNIDINYNMIKNKKNQFKENFSFSFELLKECKLKVIITAILLVVAILTGIIVAARTHTHYQIGENYGVVDVSSGGLTTTFFARLFSMLLIAVIVFGCSYLPFLFPLAMIFLCYRAYLLGLNITLMIILYGLPGVVVSLIVALPCQLIALLLLTIFYLLMAQTTKDFKCFGGTRTPSQRMKIIIITLIMLLAICVVESILLWIFSAKIILVI